MTRAPWVTEKPTRAFAKPGASFDTSIGWRFTNPAFGPDTTLSMPQTAERVAQQWGLARDELDAFALRSHQRAVDARKNGRFAAEIVPVGDVTEDEGPREDTSLEQLARLVAGASAGVPPEIMGIGPVPATRKALERADARRGLATMCVGVGQGTALLLERP
jgi:acetyl-CoA acyltransferase